MKEGCFSSYSMRENCGLFGIFGDKEAVENTYFGLHSLQHRGQEAAGIASSNGEISSMLYRNGNCQKSIPKRQRVF